MRSAHEILVSLNAYKSLSDKKNKIIEKYKEKFELQQ